MFDREAFEALTGGDPEVSRELTDLFREDVEELLESLTAALASDDDERVRRIGHTMKSSCGAMGAAEASGLALEIENGGITTARERVATLTTSVRGAIEAMEDCCTSVGA